MSGDDPPYLHVDTEVSAKYRGAFCEAKVKKINKSVKCRFVVKEANTSLLVTDDMIKGEIKVNELVEVQHPESGEPLAGYLTRVTDCSTYTVVFDDGDERTLRRSQICLKGDKHFVESETLDNLPLSNPEHFGTPVIQGIKRERKRSGRYKFSGESVDSEDEMSSEDEQTDADLEIYTRKHKALIGTVMCVEQGDKKKSSLVPMLVVLPSALTPKPKTKDALIFCSFKDGKFYMFLKKDVTEFTRSYAVKNEDKSLKSAFEKALLYYDSKTLPVSWDKEALLRGNEFGKQEDVESSDDEPSEEKDHFVAHLYKFMDDRGTPMNKGPCIGNKDLNLYKLFKVVSSLGGYNKVTNMLKWRLVYHKMRLPHSNTASHQIRTAYKKYLHAFEDFYRKLGNAMGTSTRPGRSRLNSGRSLFRDRDASMSPKARVSETNKDSSVKVLESTKARTNLEERFSAETEQKSDINENDTTKSDKIKSKKPETKLKDEATKKCITKIEEERKSVLKNTDRKDEKKEDNKDEKKEGKTDERREDKRDEKREDKNNDKKTKVKEVKASKLDESDKLGRVDLKEKVIKTSTKDKVSKGDGNEKLTKVRKEGDKNIDNTESNVHSLNKYSNNDSQSGESKRKDSKDMSTKDVKCVSGVVDVRTTKRQIRRKAMFDEDMPGKFKQENKTGLTKDLKVDLKKKPKAPKEGLPIQGMTLTLSTEEKAITYEIGTKLRVKYGKGKHLMMFEAKVMEVVGEAAKAQYLVHYAGWNLRYDEWIKPDRIISVIQKPCPNQPVQSTLTTDSRKKTHSPTLLPVANKASTMRKNLGLAKQKVKAAAVRQRPTRSSSTDSIVSQKLAIRNSRISRRNPTSATNSLEGSDKEADVVSLTNDNVLSQNLNKPVRSDMDLESDSTSIDIELADPPSSPARPTKSVEPGKESEATQVICASPITAQNNIDNADQTLHSVINDELLQLSKHMPAETPAVDAKVGTAVSTENRCNAGDKSTPIVDAVNETVEPTKDPDTSEIKSNKRKAELTESNKKKKKKTEITEPKRGKRSPRYEPEMSDDKIGVVDLGDTLVGSNSAKSVGLVIGKRKRANDDLAKPTSEDATSRIVDKPIIPERKQVKKGGKKDKPSSRNDTNKLQKAKITDEVQDLKTANAADNGIIDTDTLNECEKVDAIATKLECDATDEIAELIDTNSGAAILASIATCGIRIERDGATLGDASFSQDTDDSVVVGDGDEAMQSMLGEGGESPPAGDGSTTSNDTAGSSGNVPSSESSNDLNIARKKKHDASSSAAKRKRKGSKRHKEKHAGSESDDASFSLNQPISSLYSPTMLPKPSQPSKYNFHIEEAQNLEGDEKIEFILKKISEMRTIYLALKSEVAVIDRKRKRLRRKQSMSIVTAGVEIQCS